MRKSLTKLVALGLVAIMATGALAGCGKKDEGAKTKDGKTKLVMALWDEEQNKTMKKMIEVYQKENPNVTVETQLTTWAEYWTKLEASVTGGDAADIVWMNGLKADGYVDAGILMDVSEVAKKLDVDSNFPKTLVDAYTYDGKNYAIPKDFDTNALFYNKEMFDKAGVAYPTEDWTVEDMQKAAEQIKPSLGEGEFATAVAYNSGQTTFQGSIYANGGYILNEEKTKMGWDDPKTIEAVKPWVNMLTSGVSASQDQMADTLPDSMFEAGKLAMLMAGNYMISTFELNESIKGKYDVVSRPSFNGKKTDVINGLGYAVNAGTKHKEESLKFLEWLGGEEAMKMQGEAGTVISARNDAQQYFEATHPELNLKVFTANLDDTVLLSPKCKSYTELAVIQKQYLTEVWAGAMTIEDAAKKITDESQVILDKMNGK